MLVLEERDLMPAVELPERSLAAVVGDPAIASRRPFREVGGDLLRCRLQAATDPRWLAAVPALNPPGFARREGSIRSQSAR